MTKKHTEAVGATDASTEVPEDDHPQRASVLAWLEEKRTRGYAAAGRKFKIDVELVRKWGREAKGATKSRKGTPAPKATDDLDRLEESMVALLARRAYEEKHVGAAKAALLGIAALRSSRACAREAKAESQRGPLTRDDWATMDRGEFLRASLLETQADIAALRGGDKPSGQAVAALRRQAQLLRQDLDAHERGKLESEDLSTEDMVAGLLAMPFDVLTDPRVVTWYRTYLATGDPWAAHRTTYAVAE